MTFVQKASDNFTRPDSVGLGSNWGSFFGGIDIVSNTARPHLSGQVCDAIYTGLLTAPNDHYSEVQVSVQGAGTFCAPGVRMSTSVNKGYIALIAGPLGASAQLAIQNKPAASYVVPFQTVTINAGDIVRLSVVGNLLTAYVNGVQVLQGTDSAHTTGRPGITMYDAGNPGTARFTLFTTGQDNGVITNGLMAEYPFDDGSGTTLRDISGNNRNGTLGAGALAPLWNGGGLRFAGGHYVALPSALNAAKTIQVFCSYQAETDPNVYSSPVCGNDGSASASVGILLTSKANGSGTTLALAVDGGARAWTFGAGALKTISRSICQGYASLGLVMDTKDRLYIDGIERQDAFPAGFAAENYYLHGACVGLQTIGNYQLGGAAAGAGFSSQTYFTGDEFYALFYDRVLSPAEMALNTAAVNALLSARGIITHRPWGTSDAMQVVADGDSITAGYDGGAGIPPYTAALGLGAANIANQGEASLCLRDALTNADQTVDRFYHLNTTNPQICLVWLGSNDIANLSQTPAQVYVNLQAYCAARRAVGWKVVVLTMVSRVSFDTQKNQYNALIRAGLGTDYDALADVAANANVGADGAYSNTTYFQSGGVHLTELSYSTIIAPIVAAAIAPYLPAANDQATRTIPSAGMQPRTAAAIENWTTDADAPDIVRTINGLPAGQSITKAWFTVKAVATDSDPGIFQKAVTATEVAGIGQITNPGDTNGTAQVRIEVRRADIALMQAGKVYRYDIKVKFSSGFVPPAIEMGYVIVQQAVTVATS